MPPQVYTGEFLDSLHHVCGCTAQDFAVGLGCVLLGGLGLRLLSSRGGRRVLRVVAHVAAALALSYMIVNAQVYHVVRRFLTVTLFERGGDTLS